MPINSLQKSWIKVSYLLPRTATWIFCYACRLKSNFIWVEKPLQHLVQRLQNLVPCDLLFYKRKYGKEKPKDENSSQKGCEDLDLTDAEEEEGQEPGELLSQTHPD